MLLEIPDELITPIPADISLGAFSKRMALMRGVLPVSNGGPQVDMWRTCIDYSLRFRWDMGEEDADEAMLVQHYEDYCARIAADDEAKLPPYYNYRRHVEVLRGVVKKNIRLVIEPLRSFMKTQHISTKLQLYVNQPYVKFSLDADALTGRENAWQGAPHGIHALLLPEFSLGVRTPYFAELMARTCV